MSKRSAFLRQGTRYVVLSCLLVIFTWLIHPPAVLSQPAGQQSVKVEVLSEVLLGSTVEVGVSWINDDSTFEVGGFDLLISYDDTALALLGVNTGQLLSDCAWEYFTYRVEVAHPHTIRLVAIADINNGDIHPSCYGNSSGELAELLFRLTGDTFYYCRFVPIRFIWYDCSDNAFASRSGDTLFISRDVYDYVGDNNYVQIDQDSPLPTFVGAPDTCTDSISGKPGGIRMIDFYNGGVSIDCVDTIDYRGDLNLNGISYELVDWMMFVNYLLYGDTVFNIDPALQAEVTDVNCDGIPLTLDDLVYMWRVVIGDAIPFRQSQSAGDTAFFIQESNTRVVSISYPDSLSSAYLIFRGAIEPTSLIADVDAMYHFDGAHTRVLAFRSFQNFIDPPPVFEPGPLLSYTGDGFLEQAHTSLDGLSRIETAIILNGYPGTHADIFPDTISAYWAFSTDTTISTIYIGDFADQVVSDIDQATIHVNDTMTAISTQIVSGWPNFTGDVLAVRCSADEFIRGYLPLPDTSLHSYMVTGEFVDDTPFTVFGEVILGGLMNGDVDLDGAVNIADVIYLVDYLFRQGDAPPVMQSADIDGDGSINVADVTALVYLLFG